MGGVIGAISGKFVLLGVGMIVSGSIEKHRVRAWIDPASETSVVSQRAADEIDRDGSTHVPGSVLRRGHPMVVALSAGTFPVDALAVASVPLSADVDFVIGRDIFGSHVFDLDFRSHQIRMVLSYEYQHATRGLTPTPLPSADLDLHAFEGRHILIDLPHRLLWIDPRGAAAAPPARRG